MRKRCPGVTALAATALGEGRMEAAAEAGAGLPLMVHMVVTSDHLGEVTTIIVTVMVAVATVATVVEVTKASWTAAYRLQRSLTSCSEKSHLKIMRHCSA